MLRAILIKLCLGVENFLRNNLKSKWPKKIFLCRHKLLWSYSSDTMVYNCSWTWMMMLFFIFSDDIKGAYGWHQQLYHSSKYIFRAHFYFIPCGDLGKSKWAEGYQHSNRKLPSSLKIIFFFPLIGQPRFSRFQIRWLHQVFPPNSYNRLAD